jgi:hypothetical protein
MKMKKFEGPFDHFHPFFISMGNHYGGATVSIMIEPQTSLK